MSYNISKAKLVKISLFSISSKKFGYGHYNRVQNLISILKNKKNNLKHYCLGKNFKNKHLFLEKMRTEVNSNKKIILDLTNKLFLDKKTILKIKKILLSYKNNKIYLIDEPSKRNLSIILNLQNTKTLIPYEVEDKVKKKFSNYKNITTGFKYFVYPPKKVKKENKIFDITLSFGGSDNFQGTLYVLKLLKELKIKKKVVVIIGKFFKKNYQNKIISFCKNNKFQVRTFSRNFYNILNKTKILITNSGLTKYEGVCHQIPIIVFSDTKESQKIDKVFIKKTKQIHFSYLKRKDHDILKFKKIMKTKINSKVFDIDKNKSYMNIIKFFLTN